MEGVQEINSSKDDYGLEECSVVSDPFNYLLDPQQCPICHLDLFGYLHLSNYG
uniref:Cmp-sialic acid transporter n=1 Tax=Rhizophora mucronata TaxID=61149 RepID=A0A2P2KUN6_RHIMU